MMKGDTMEKQKAFTLIELLVVISIIAILMSILMPALSKVRSQAQKVVCKTRLKSIYNAAGLYAQDNEGRLGDTSRYGAKYTLKDGDVIDVWAYNRCWFLMYEDYLESLGARECPAAKPYPKDGFMEYMTSGSPNTMNGAGLFKGVDYEGVALGYTPNAYCYPVYDEATKTYSTTNSFAEKWTQNEVAHTMDRVASSFAKNQSQGIMFWDGTYTISVTNMLPATLAGRYGSDGIFRGRAYYRHGKSGSGGRGPQTVTPATDYPGGGKVTSNALLGDGHVGSIERRDGFNLMRDGTLILPSMLD
jgi:prepilin-type N-terminal cleavage/methylation domain-containing protein